MFALWMFDSKGGSKDYRCKSDMLPIWVMDFGFCGKSFRKVTWQLFARGDVSFSLFLCCYFQVCQPQPSQLYSAGTTGAGGHSQSWANREFVEGSRRCWVVRYPPAQGARGEKNHKNEVHGSEKQQGNAQIYPFRHRKIVQLNSCWVHMG